MQKMVVQKQCPAVVCIVFVLLAALAGCKNDDQLSPQDYDFANPHKSELGKGLKEISGINFIAADSSLIAISDSKEKVYQIDLKGKKLEDYTPKVIPAGIDPEDIVVLDTTIFILISKGIIVEVPHSATDSAATKTYQLGLSGKNDFETLYYDPTAQGLVMLCKTCAHEKGREIRTAYRFDLRSRSFDSSSFFTISRLQVKQQVKDNNADFEPSAAAIHPVSKRLYILGSSGKLLVITDTRGQVLEAYQLNPNVFPQAEGIAFAPNGDLYISNEGKYGNPTLLRFDYKQKGTKKEK